MGLPDVYSITVEGGKNFRAAIESEERASYAWMGKWGWILDEYKTINQELAQLKEGRKFKEEVTEVEDNRTTRPYSETEGHEYGFLAKKPEFRLEIFSSPGLTPLPNKLHPALFYKLVDELMQEKMKKRLESMTPVNVDRAYKETFKSEERAARLWHKKWSWLIEEYRKIYDELKALKDSKPQRDNIVKKKEFDDRTMRPCPESTGHEYGHLSSKPEFALEIFSSPGLTPLNKTLTHKDLYEALDKRFTKRYSSTHHHGFLDYYKKTTKPQEGPDYFDLAMRAQF